MADSVGKYGINVSIETRYENLQSVFRYADAKLRSQIASEVNKLVRDGRREVVDELIAETGLKRKILNDAIVITRANPNSEEISGHMQAIFSEKKIRLGDYPHTTNATYRGRPAIRMLSKYYSKTIKTGFMSKDGSRIVMRSLEEGKQYIKWYPYGRSVKGLFLDLKVKERYEPKFATDFKERMVQFLSVAGVLSE